jgi:N-succinyldiaminopimelate aminotransferase
VNPDLAKLQPYPFERLRLLFKDITPDPRYTAIKHVAENRRRYAHKFSAVQPLLQAPLVTGVPEGDFYFWSQTPVDDEHFAAALYREYNVTVLPGSYLARVAHGRNPGRSYVRMALEAPRL